MRSRLRLTALAAVTSLALTIASAPVNAAEATPEQFIGTWIGTWPNGKSTIEILVDHIDADGNVYGIYCWVSNTHDWRNWFDIHPDSAAGKLEKGKIRWKGDGKRRGVFSVRGKEETTLRMEIWNRKGKKSTLRKLTRETVEDSDCLSRLSRLPGPDEE